VAQNIKTAEKQGVYQIFVIDGELLFRLEWPFLLPDCILDVLDLGQFW
jgi:hypothetical protein